MSEGWSTPTQDTPTVKSWSTPKPAVAANGWSAPSAAPPPAPKPKAPGLTPKSVANDFVAPIKRGFTSVAEREIEAGKQFGGGFKKAFATPPKPGEDAGGASVDRLIEGGTDMASGVFNAAIGAPVGGMVEGWTKPLDPLSTKISGGPISGTAGDVAGMAAGAAMGGRNVKPVEVEMRRAPGAKPLAHGPETTTPETLPGKAAKTAAPKLNAPGKASFKASGWTEPAMPNASAALERGKTKTMAEAPKPQEREIVSPGPAGEGGPVVGGEADPVERVDNALYRLGGHATADKVEAQQFLKALPKEVSDPKVQEELYHAIEAKLVDPAAVVPDHLKPAMEAFAPYYKEQTDIINRLRERGDPELEPYLEDQGYVARRAVGHTPIMDQGPGAQVRDPILGQRSLTKTAQAQKQRTAGFVTTDAKGKTTFWKGQPPETDLMGQPYASVRQATTKEIEANSGVRYHKNALVNTVDNVIRLRRVERNLQVLDEVTKNLKDEGKAWQSEWRFKDPETGQMVVRRANTERPEGFTELPHVPQLRGWYFDPKVAQALKDYYPSPKEPLETVLGKVNHALTASLFITPIPHAMNVGAHWAVGRGWDWVSPASYARLMRTGTKAASEVLGMGPKYREMLREGSGLLYGDTQVRDFHKFLFEKAGHEVLDDPKAASTLAKAAGMPLEAVKAAYAASNKALWAANDIFMLQRQMELEAKGMSTRKAISEAEKDIPNYRIPPQVLKSRALSQMLQSKNVIMFGRYKYGQMKAWGSMFKDMVAKDATPQERWDAFGKFVAAMTIANVAYPMADAALKQMTGNKDARLHRSGPFSMSDAAYQFATGQKDFAAALSSFMIPAPVADLGVEAISNRDEFTGQPMIDPNGSPEGMAVQAGERAADKFYPAQLALDATKPGGVPQSLGKLAGVDLPPEGRQERRAKYKGRAKKQALKREAKDPIMQALPQ